MEKSVDYFGFIVALIFFAFIFLKRLFAVAKPVEVKKKVPLHDLLHTITKEEETVERLEIVPPAPPAPALTIQEYEEKVGVEAHHLKTAFEMPEVEILEEERPTLQTLLNEQKHPIALILFHDLLERPKSW